jgi:pimeloyl-ACP methyl ester carboxylesterase
VEVSERFVDVAGGRCRLLEKGAGDPIAVLPGLLGFPRWTSFLDRLAEARKVVLLSPPGFPGSDAHHEKLDGHLDWLSATFDLLDACAIDRCDLVAASVGAMLAIDIAAFDASRVRRLSLTGPYGIYDMKEPVRDYFAEVPDVQRGLLCRDATAYDACFGDPQDEEEATEHQLMLYRAASAAARLSWPLGDRGARKRLHRLTMAVQLIWGSEDALVPLSYADRFAAGLPVAPERITIEGAGHLAWIDEPQACSRAILNFLR